MVEGKARKKGGGEESEEGMGRGGGGGMTKEISMGEGVREEKTNRRTRQAGRTADPEGLVGQAARADPNGRVGRRTLAGGSGGRWLPSERTGGL